MLVKSICYAIFLNLGNEEGGQMNNEVIHNVNEFEGRIQYILDENMLFPYLKYKILRRK